MRLSQCLQNKQSKDCGGIEAIFVTIYVIFIEWPFWPLDKNVTFVNNGNMVSN